MRPRRKKTYQPSFVRQNFSLILTSIVTLILLLSVIYRRDPVSLIHDAYLALATDNTSVGKSIPEYRREIECLLLQRDSLQEIADKYEELTSVQIVHFKDKEGHINLRSLPDIDSEVIIKIPASEPVELIFLDQETQYLLGEYGQWAKTRYKNREGWVWSGLLILDADYH
jgi:hypothetical protein